MSQFLVSCVLNRCLVFFNYLSLKRPIYKCPQWDMIFISFWKIYCCFNLKYRIYGILEASEYFCPLSDQTKTLTNCDAFQITMFLMTWEYWYYWPLPLLCERSELFMDKNMYLGFSSHGFTYWWIYLISAHCKHVPCSTLTHSTNEDLLNINRKGDAKSRILSHTSDTTETRNPCVISHFVSLFYLYWYFQILLSLFWHTDKKCFFCVEVNFWDLIRNNESLIEWD